MIRLSSSCRALTLEAALARARAAANTCGISRVTDVTPLDRVGIPVCVSFRPNASTGSLCVNAGKGMDPLEARVGAYMEAIEYAYAEPQRSPLPVLRAPIGQMLSGRGCGSEVLDLCPLAGKEVVGETKVPCVEASDLDGRSVLVPAELVFYPYPLPPAQMLFASSTNGLASGATVAEATLHGLCEAIERDIASFRRIGATAESVDLRSLPPHIRDTIDRLTDQGFGFAVEHVPNSFGLAWFKAMLWENGILDPLFVNAGTGCHLDPEIALSRAIAEAAQCRLTQIHGARDDIDRRADRLSRMTERRRRAYARKAIGQARAHGAKRDFSSLPNNARDCATLDDLLDELRSRLERNRITRVLRVILIPKGAPVRVVRVIVPKLEHCTPAAPRIGARLARYASRN